jgi:glycerol kinase
MRETTALGAAIAAGFAAGVWKSFDDLKEINKEGRFFFKPKISQKASDKMYRKWSKAVEMSKGWRDESEDEEDEEGKGSDQQLEEEQNFLEQVTTKDQYPE